MVTIRRYRRQDRATLRGLVLQLHETVRPFDADLAPGESIIEGHFGNLLTRVEESSGAIFVAEVESRLVGYVCVLGSVRPTDLDERSDPYSFMAELFVHPEFRSEGIGSDLVAEAERFARQCGTYKMELTVLARNESSIRLYERLGYAPRLIVMTKRM